MKATAFVFLLAGAAFAPVHAYAQTPPTHKDIVYATVDGKNLGLDLYMPINQSHELEGAYEEMGGGRVRSRSCAGQSDSRLRAQGSRLRQKTFE